MAVLEIRNLQVHFRQDRRCIKAVDGVDLDLEKGTVLGLIGQSGSGKTVLSTALLGLIEPPGRIVGGRIIYKGRNLLKLDRNGMRKIRGNKMFLIFQSSASCLNPALKVKNQIAEILTRHKGLTRRAAQLEVDCLLEQVSLPVSKKELYPFELSGGMQQRVLIAMAMALEPEILVADEPTTGLDTITQKEVVLLLEKWQKNTLGTMLLISHDLRLVMKMASRIAVMYQGRIVESGPAKNFLHTGRHPFTQELIENIRAIEDLPGGGRC